MVGQGGKRVKGRLIRVVDYGKDCVRVSMVPALSSVTLTTNMMVSKWLD